MDKFRQRAVLSCLDQHGTDKSLNPEVLQINDCLNGNLLIGDGGIANTDRPQIVECGMGLKFTETVIVNQPLCQCQLCPSADIIGKGQRVQIRTAGKANIVEHIVHIGFL